MISISDLKDRAKTSLEGHFGYAILMMVLYNVISQAVTSVPQYLIMPMLPSLEGSSELTATFITVIVISTILVLAISILILPIVQIGYIAFHIGLAKGEREDIMIMFKGFQEDYFFKIKTILLVTGLSLLWMIPYIVFAGLGVFFLTTETLAAGYLCFVLAFVALIAAIIKIMDYNFVTYLLADKDEPSMGFSMDYVRRSADMIRGHKWTFFLTGLSFIGWILLVPFTCGLIMFYVGPYMQQTFAELYDDLS